MDLIQRRLNTLVRVLRMTAATRMRFPDHELTAQEMLDWAKQVENIANARHDPLLR